jgi:DNA-binding CsgD family transcriptional regulator/tetratricopeptide (TPR) repeat protein
MARRVAAINQAPSLLAHLGALGGHVVLTGEPGSGKTHALAAFEATIPRDQLLLVLRSSSVTPSSAFGSLAVRESWASGSVLDLVDPDAPAGAPGSLRAAERLARHLCASARPVVVIVDGPTRLDPASVRLLSCLVVRASPGVRMVLLAAVDPAEIPFPVPRPAEALVVEPAGERELLGIVAAAMGDEASSRISDSIAGANGNPALALLAASVAGPDLAGPPVLPLERIPHLERLSDETRSLLRSASMLGRAFGVISLAAVTGTSVSDLLPVLDEAFAARVLEGTGSRIGFRHPWVHGSLYGSIPEAVRGALHREYADRMAAIPDVDPFDVAQQIAQGTGRREGDVPLLRRASVLALGHDPSEAAALLERAISVAGPAHPGLDELLADRVSALLAAGRASEARMLAAGILARGTPPAIAATIRMALSQALLLEDDLSGSIEQLEAAAAEPGLGPVETNRVMAEKSLRHALSGELALARAEAESAARRAQPMGDDLATSVASSTLAHVAYYGGDVGAAVDLARVAVRAADAAGSDPTGRRARYELGMFLLHGDQLEEAGRVFGAELERAASMGASWFAPLHHYGLAFRHLYAGEWEAAEQEFRRGLALVSTAETRWESASARAHLAVIAVGRGNLRGAEEMLPTVRREPSSIPHESRDAVLWAQGHLLEARGEQQAALEALLAASRSAMTSGARARLRWIVPDLARVAAGAGQGHQARELVEALEAVADVAHVAYVLGAALRSRALVADDSQAMAAALKAYRSSNRFMELAATLEEAGLMHVRAGEATEGVPLLDEAAEMYERMTASAAAARVRSHLRALGLRRVSGRRRAAEGWESLTDAERQIVGLVANGMTNREIAGRLVVSPRTVETHLRHIYEKLALNSRVELATRAVGQAW